MCGIVISFLSASLAGEGEGKSAPGLNEGMTLVVALFCLCILTRNNPQMNHLGIHPYSQEDEYILRVTDIACVYGLVGRVNDGPNSWAIIDRSNRVSRVAHLTISMIHLHLLVVD